MTPSAPPSPDPILLALAALHEAGDPSVLRRVAADIARRLLPEAPPAAQRLVDAADRSARGDDCLLGSVREELSGAATAAGTVGLRHGAANAPALLAAYGACAPDPFDAAVQSVRYSRLHARLANLHLAEVDLDLLSRLP